jgi:hypothetical protein
VNGEKSTIVPSPGREDLLVDPDCSGKEDSVTSGLTMTCEMKPSRDRIDECP